MMTLTRWNPTRDLMNITEDMNRFMSNVFSDQGTRETSLFRGTWSPQVDISEDKDNFYLHVELPGMNHDDVNVRYEEGMLTITGEKKVQDERNERNYHRVERGYGRFERSFRLTSNIDADKIAADFSNGVLAITLPKLETAKPKEIEVKIK